MDTFFSRLLLNALYIACLLPAAGWANDENYILKAGDGLMMKVFNEAELETETRILRTGEVSFPLIGSLKLEGLTVQEAVGKIYELYNADYLVEPKITLSVTDYAPEYVDVLGEVKTAGRVRIPSGGRLDLASLFAMAGGFTEEADRNRITVIKGDGQVLKYNGSQASEASLQRVLLSPSDRVIVGKSAFVGRTFTILGEVKAEGPYPFPLNGRLDIVAAMAAAGGLTELANAKKVTVRRGEQTIELDYQSLSREGQKFAIQPGDIISIARRIF